MRRAEQAGQQRCGAAILLATGFENAEQIALGARAGRSAIAAPHLPRDHHGANRLFGAPVGGFQAGTVQEGEQRVALPPEMVGQASILWGAARFPEQAIHAGFQLTPRHRQPVFADLTLIATPAQTQRGLQNLPHRPWKRRGLTLTVVCQVRCQCHRF